jgi:hypothetical protein
MPETRKLTEVFSRSYFESLLSQESKVTLSRIEQQIEAAYKTGKGGIFIAQIELDALEIVINGNFIAHEYARPIQQILQCREQKLPAPQLILPEQYIDSEPAQAFDVEALIAAEASEIDADDLDEEDEFDGINYFDSGY